MQRVWSIVLAAGLSTAAVAQMPSEAYRPASAGLDAVTQSVGLDLQRVRVDRWKTDGATKEQQIHNVQSLERSLTATLPEQSAAARQSGDVATMFRLYRTLSATCDVLRDVAESAGAFGSKGEYEQLAGDLNQLSQARAQLAEQIDAAAQQQTAQLNALRNAATQAQAAPSPTASKKIIVDNDAPPPKKTTARKKKAPAATGDGGAAAQPAAPKNQ